MLKTLVSGHYTLDSWNLYMIVEKRGGIITVVKALVSRRDTLEVPVNLFLWKNPHTASSPFLERVSPQGCLWATGQNITVAI
jgi:hypothetical protein